MRAWPIGQVGNRLNIIRASFPRGPHAHDFDSSLCRLAQSFRHARAIFFAVHQRDIRPHEAKWLAIKLEPAAVSRDEPGTSTTVRSAPVGKRKQNRRARN